MNQSQTGSAPTPAGRGNRLLAAFRPDLLWMRVSLEGMPGRPFRPRIVLEGDPRPEAPPEVLHRQLGIVQDNLPMALLVNGLVAAILGLSFMTPATRTAEAVWILAFLLLAGCRYWDVRARRGGAPEDRMAGTRRRLFLGAGLQGLLWGVAGTFLLPADPLQQLCLISVIAGVTAGAVLVYSPIWAAFALYAVPSLFPICLRLMGGPLLAQKLTGGLGLIYSVTLLFMAARISRWLAESLEATRANATLTRHLQSANQALVAYHADLEAAVADRTRELRETNAQLQREMAANEQERSRAEEREEALRRAQKLESLGVLAGGIAHDFNNLLGAILGNLNLLQLHVPPGSPGTAFLTNMETAVNRARNLTFQMLAYSGKGHFAIQSLDLNRVVLELTSLLDVCISKRAALKLELAQEPCVIFGDQAQLQQVVMNLVTNASEALAGTDGEIRIATRVQDLDPAAAARVSQVVPTLPGPHVVLEVRDTGPGMDPEVLSRIFDPFFTTKESGRGLGLSAMLGILKGHGAGLEIVSRPQAGSTFRLFFPASAGAPESAAAQAGAAYGPFSGQILVVDDEPEVLTTARLMLENLGLKVAAARNGLEALAFMGTHAAEIDVVLLDLTMPQMDGRQTLRALRRLCPGLPVILSSGYDPRQAPTGVRDLESPAFLQKPYTLAELQRVLARALGPEPILI